MIATILLGMGALTCAASVSGDCGAESFADEISVAEALVITRSPIVIPRGPVRARPSAVCVRLEFSIDENGAPTKILIAHSSGHRKFDTAAVRALARFKFKTTGQSAPVDVLTLVLRGEVD